MFGGMVKIGSILWWLVDPEVHICEGGGGVDKPHATWPPVEAGTTINQLGKDKSWVSLGGNEGHTDVRV